MLLGPCSHGNRKYLNQIQAREAPFFFPKGMFTGCHVNPHVTGRIDLCCYEFRVAEPKVQEASSNFPLRSERNAGCYWEHYADLKNGLLKG